MRDLKEILTKFREIVSQDFCNDLARKCRLIQRSTSRLKGHDFAQAMMTPNAFLEMETLNSIAIRMKRINGACDLSASALAQRLNTKAAVAFMKACYGKVLKEIMKKELTSAYDLPNLSGFNRILIEDSTRAELHEKLSPSFKGSCGAASKSSVKIDYIFDYLSGGFVRIDFFSGNIPDQSLAKILIPFLEKDDLVIRDLGYHVLESFKEIEQEGAYYVSRFKVDILVYESKEAEKPLDLGKFLDQRVKMGQGIVDVEVFIAEERYPTRLIAALLDEEVINKRRRAANRAAQRRGTQVSKKKSALLKYALFITNAPAMILSSEAVMMTYRARWRIELIFKEWKSCLKLHLFKGYNKERLQCFMYGRMIMILLLGALSPPLMLYALTLNRELSCYKLINYLIADHALARALQEGKIDHFIGELLEELPRRLCMDKRKRPSLRKNIRMGNSYYNGLRINGLCQKAA